MVFTFFNLVLQKYGKLFLKMCGNPVKRFVLESSFQWKLQRNILA